MKADHAQALEMQQRISNNVCAHAQSVGQAAYGRQLLSQPNPLLAHMSHDSLKQVLCLRRCLGGNSIECVLHSESPRVNSSVTSRKENTNPVNISSIRIYMLIINIFLQFTGGDFQGKQTTA
jgi:hypothetical protein